MMLRLDSRSFFLLHGFLVSLSKSRARREAETLVLRHQINILRRKAPWRVLLTRVDRPLRRADGVVSIAVRIPDASPWPAATPAPRGDRASDRGMDCPSDRARLRRGSSATLPHPRSPWQNAYAERPIGSIRHECLDHIVVFGEQYLRHVLETYTIYYNQVRPCLSLNKDAPVSRSA